MHPPKTTQNFRNLKASLGLYWGLHFAVEESRLMSRETNECIWKLGVLGGSDSKESACNAGDLGSIPGSGRSPGEGHGYPLQCSCLENPMDRGARRVTVHGVAKSQTRLKRLSTCCFILILNTDGSITGAYWLCGLRQVSWSLWFSILKSVNLENFCLLRGLLHAGDSALCLELSHRSADANYPRGTGREQWVFRGQRDDFLKRDHRGFKGALASELVFENL